MRHYFLIAIFFTAGCGGTNFSANSNSKTQEAVQPSPTSNNIVKASPEPKPQAASPSPSPAPQQGPRVGCRVHFSGAMMATKIGQSSAISLPYQVDQFSELVGDGSYPNNAVAFPKAVSTTFDAIAIDSGTHLVIYAGQNFTGAKV